MAGLIDMPRQPGVLSTLAVLLVAILAVTLTGPSRAAEPVVRPALDGIFAAFESHPMVGLGDQHELANELEFYASLVRDPRFAAIVGNVVVEFGASQHQDILDRYLAGEDVSYSELSKVWRNTVAWDPTVLGVGYQTSLAQVRAVNLPLPTSRRIRVWLSEPPIDWSAVHAKEAWQRIYDQRDPHAPTSSRGKSWTAGKRRSSSTGPAISSRFRGPRPCRFPQPGRPRCAR